MNTPVAALAICTLGSTLSAPRAGVAPVTPEELVRFSDRVVVGRVVVGRVERVVGVPRDPQRSDSEDFSNRQWLRTSASVPVADVVVERTLHGPPLESVQFLACGTWTCDISGAEVGESVLLFLKGTRWMSEEGAAIHEALVDLARGIPASCASSVACEPTGPRSQPRGAGRSRRNSPGDPQESWNDPRTPRSWA